jgi:predicted permease
MANPSQIADAVLPVGKVMIPIGLGLLLRLVRLFGDDEGELLRKFVVRFTVPLFVFFSLYGAEAESLASIGPMVFALVAMTAGLFLLGWAVALTVRGAPQRAAVHACVTFGNYGWMGLGVAQALLGDAGSQRVVYFILLWWPVFYGFGLPIGLIHGERRKGRIPLGRAAAVAAPVLVAMALGLAANLGGVALPSLVDTALRPFADMTVPLILLSVGLLLDPTRLRARLRPALAISAATLVVGPLLGWLLARWLAPDPTTASAIVLLGAMPVATLVPVLGESYEMDMGIVNTAIVLSTLLSLVTIPVTAILLGG